MKHNKQTVKEAAEQMGTELKKESGGLFEKVSQKTLEDSFTVKSLAGITDEKEEAIYGQAYLLYNTGKYREATEIFRILIMINSTEPKYMMGLAACFHMMKEYSAALNTYTICGLLDPNSPVPHFHAADCHIQNGDNISAMVSLQMAIKRAEGKAEYKNLKERSEMTLEGLKKQISQKE